MKIENRLKTPLTAEEEQAAWRIAKIAEGGWPVPWGGTVKCGALELVERTTGGSRDEITIGFSGGGENTLVVPRGALESAVAKMKKGEF